MHQHPRHFRVGEQRRHVGIGAAAGHVVDDLSAVLQCRARHVGVHRVDAHRKPLPGKLFDHGQHTRGFHPRVDAGGAGPGRLAADVDDGRAIGGQCQAMLDGTVAVEEQTPVGEGIVGDVHDSHYPHVSQGSLPQDQIQRLGP